MEEKEIHLEKEMHLRDYFRIIRKRKYTVYTFFIITVALAVLYTYTATPLYKSTAKILIEKGEQNVLLTSYGYVQYDPEFMETQIQIIQSTPVAKKVVNMLNLVDTYDSFFKHLEGRITLDTLVSSLQDWGKGLYSTIIAVAGVVKKEPGSDKEGAAPDLVSKDEKIAQSISAGITVEPVKESRILDISFTSSNPVLARMIVNSVTKAYMEKILEMKMESSGYTIKWMTEKADEERERLRQSEIALQEYMKAQDIVTLENRLAMNPQKMTELNTQLTLAQTKRKELEAVFEKVKRLAGNEDAVESVEMISSDPTIQLLRGQILESEKRIMDLSKKYGPKHPVMKTAVGDLEMLQQKRAFEIKRVAGIVQTQYELALAKEHDLADLLKKTKAETILSNEKFIQYNLLKRDVDTNRQLYDALVSKVKEQGVSEKVQSVKVWVVEDAKTPKVPSKPQKRRNILLGLVLGLFGGIGIAFFLEYLDNTVKYPDDVQDRFGVPVLSSVPLLSSRKKSPEVAAITESSNSFAESYKSIRTAVLLSSAGGPPKKLLVTSMSVTEGKTTTAINLAVAFARAHKRTLLVDGDMRKPRIHKIFDLENDEGLSTYLAGGSDAKTHQIDAVENLFIITAGPTPPNPSELLGPERLDEFLTAAAKHFDHIIFDSPPVLTVSDSLILSKTLDGTIIVARAGKATYDMIEKGLKVLGDIRAPILGFVLNAVVLKRSTYYYYHNYYESYYSSDKGKK
jgi:succinoglycan biosynthesis transport protein ExoP